MELKSEEMIEFKGQLTSADMRQTVPTFFDVPEGVEELRIRFDFSPKRGANQRMPHQLRVMFFDTEGPRFEICKPKDELYFINRAEASKGGMPGEIQPGRWRFFLLVHRLLTVEPVEYSMTISFSYEPIKAEPKTFIPGKTAPRGPGWYKGDLHAHTIHSDGRWDVPDLVDFWREREVDFVTLSDHNIISGLAELHSYADDDLLTLGGIELTTFFGHAVAVGIDKWYDWRKIDGSMVSISEVAQEVIDSGALLTIAHPMTQGDPICCGCRWHDYDMYPGNALAVEVWNKGWKETNEAALQLFYRWINEGHRLTAVSGSDQHGPLRDDRRIAHNVVYAQELSQEGILEGIKAGRSYVSSGPELRLSATTASGETGMLGDTLPGEKATAQIVWSEGLPDSGLRLLVNGWVFHEQVVGEAGTIEWDLPTGARWINVELRDGMNGLLAVTNPIFFETSS